MSLNINNEETCELAKELTTLTGESEKMYLGFLHFVGTSYG